MIYYSRSTNGFYHRDVHGDARPSDCVEITAEKHAELLEGQSAGKLIVPGPKGRPQLAARPKPDAAVLWARVRRDRDRRLAACDWTQLLDVPAATRTAWQAYRQALRDVTQQKSPASIRWPEPPGTAE